LGKSLLPLRQVAPRRVSARAPPWMGPRAAALLRVGRRSHSSLRSLCAEACPRPRASPKSEIMKTQRAISVYYGKSSPRPARAGHSTQTPQRHRGLLSSLVPSPSCPPSKRKGPRSAAPDRTRQGANELPPDRAASNGLCPRVLAASARHLRPASSVMTPAAAASALVSSAARQGQAPSAPCPPSCARHRRACLRRRRRAGRRLET